MTRRAPALATWLLERFGVKWQNEALIGDLAEEYQAGKSAAWYWWQTLVAIALAVPRDIRQHKLLALRAIAIGWILARAFGWFFGDMTTHLPPWIMNHWSPPAQFVFGPIMVPWSLLKLALIGWMLLKLVLIGWLVARTHRAQAAAMVLIFATSRILYASTLYMSHYMSHYLVSGTYGWSLHIFLQQYLMIFTNLAIQGLFIITGGFLVAPKAQPGPSSSA